MSYRSREKKRRKRAAIRNVRTRHGETIKGRHYLTVVQRDCCCNVCGRSLRVTRGDDVVYRHEPRELLCLSCADDRGVEYRTSRRWERNRTSKRRPR